MPVNALSDIVHHKHRGPYIAGFHPTLIQDDHDGSFLRSKITPTARGRFYLQQVDRVTPHLGHLARWVETLALQTRAGG